MFQPIIAKLKYIMATRKFKLNNTRVTKDNIVYKMKSPTEASVASNTTNTRSFTSAVTYNAYKTIDDTANKMRGKINDFLSDLLGTEVDEFCGFNDRNERYMRRLMLLNVSEHDITMDSLGTDAALLGDGSKITNMAQSPTYASDINYTDNFARQIDGDEKHGINTTRYAEDENSGNYVNHGQLYSKTTNVYYDDNGTGTFDEQMTNGNQNSILYKTKVLFEKAKINTIISRFHTDGGSGSGNGNENVGSIGDAKSKFGKSHGRNLLLKSAENGKGTGYSINGYNNPYCRVWTHHFQYDKLYKRIRPFYEWDENGNYKSVRTLKDFHNWKSFGHDIVSNVTNSISDKKKKWSWKVDTADLWNRSVLQNNGFVNITPKHIGNGGKENIHTKDCMFSIENLAWKGYNPYSFEQALSWEQRGPNGGRIMWFPPYGIEFNETTNVNWVEHQFIGRGENVYTYANTTRTGTLSFMLIVDHPSVIDYVQWHGGTKEGGDTVKDSDLLRFFAGCDSGNSEDEDSLLSYVKPTPLTDEYVQTPIEETLTIDVPKPKEPEKTTNTETLALSFYVFYPNNYSGTYDHMNNTVEAIAYLLAGDGAQKKNGDTKSETDDEPLTMNMLLKQSYFKKGYEALTNSSGVSDTSTESTNYIYGTKPIWQYQTKRSNYIANNKKWYYRTDGEYKKPSNGDYYRNTYDQTLLKDGNYKDTSNYKLNSDADVVRSNMKELEDDEGKTELYSLAEVAAALENTIDSQIKTNIIEKCGIKADRVNKLITIFGGDDEEDEQGNKKTKYKIKSVNGIGYSNSHDSNKTKSVASNKTVSTERNDLLAKQRCETVFDWLTNRYKDIFSGVDTSSEVQSSNSGVKITTTDVSNIEAKKWRSAKITITLEREVTTTLSTSDSGETTKYVGYTEKKDSNGNTYYEDEQGNKWTLSADSKHFTRVATTGYSASARSSNGTGTKHFGSWVETNQVVYMMHAQKYPSYFKIEKNRDGTVKYYKNTALDTSFSFGFENGKFTFDDTSTIDSDENVVYNNLRYDQEYHFFKQIQDTDPMVWDSLMKKIQYFDPAFHSSSPESFNARLTFLQQCTRQGNTIGASDSLGKSANNLAFGQAPYCILRLGDFYHQMICIDNINIDYEGPTWDLNTEGIGVQPLLAKVSLSFKFIGGGSMDGAVRRLQNAMTFNYYANTGLYDNRADRPKYVANEITGISTLDVDNSYAYTTQMAKPDSNK